MKSSTTRRRPLGGRRSRWVPFVGMFLAACAPRVMGVKERADVMDLSDCARRLEARWRVPVSSIAEQVGGVDCPLDSPAGSLRASLAELAARTPALTWREIRGHHVIFPRAPEWEEEHAVAIADTPRAEAARRYLEAIAPTRPAFARLSGPPVKGDPDHPIYAAHVSLSPRASVVTHLVELLGDDPRFAFTIQAMPDGRHVLYFHALGD